MTVAIETGGDRPESDDGSFAATGALISNVRVRGFFASVRSLVTNEEFGGSVIDRCDFGGDVVLDTGLSSHPNVTIRDTRMRHLLGTTSSVRTLRWLTVDGVNAASIRLHGTSFDESLRDVSIRAKLRAGQTVPARVDLTWAVNATVDVQVETPAEHGVRLTDCTNVRVVGLVEGPNSGAYDAVHVDGGERVIVRADVIGTGNTRHAVNIVSGDRHRILADLGADADYDAGAVADAGTGTVDQSVVD